MRPIRTIAILPTMFTLGNLVCGFFAIVVASRIVPMRLDESGKPVIVVSDPDPSAADSRSDTTQDKGPAKVVTKPATESPGGEDSETSFWPSFKGFRIGAKDPENCMLSAWLIFIAMIFDALDGYVARLSRTSSDFGAQLDSLCDLVTFGVAPAFLLVKMCPEFASIHRQSVWIIAAAFAACAALRLARFNVETSDEDEHLHFNGLPSPAAAASVAGFAIMFYTLRMGDPRPPYAHEIDVALQMALPFFALLVAVLMVSRIPYPHIVNQVFRGQRSFGHLVAILFTAVAIMVVRQYAVPIICVSFVFYAPIRFAWEWFVERRHQQESIF